MSAAAPTSRRPGVGGMGIVRRIMGLLVTGIAFQMPVEGLTKLLPRSGLKLSRSGALLGAPERQRS